MQTLFSLAFFFYLQAEQNRKNRNYLSDPSPLFLSFSPTAILILHFNTFIFHLLFAFCFSFLICYYILFYCFILFFFSILADINRLKGEFKFLEKKVSEEEIKFENLKSLCGDQINILQGVSVRTVRAMIHVFIYFASFAFCFIFILFLFYFLFIFYLFFINFSFIFYLFFIYFLYIFYLFFMYFYAISIILLLF